MLAGLLWEHRGPLSADLRRFYGCNLTDVLAGEVAPLREVSEWVAHLPPGSAVHIATHPDGEWQHTHELELSRSTLYELSRATFYLARRAGYKVPEPEPYRFPWEPEDDDAIRGDAMSMDEADDFLGWNEEMKEHFRSLDDD